MDYSLGRPLTIGPSCAACMDMGFAYGDWVTAIRRPLCSSGCSGSIRPTIKGLGFFFLMYKPDVSGSPTRKDHSKGFHRVDSRRGTEGDTLGSRPSMLRRS